VVVDISGINPDDVRVIASEQTLVISGERPRQLCEGRVYQQMEIEYGSFERVLQLPDDADVSQAEARYDRGLLTIVMPIAVKATQPERVPIEIRRAS
jgi:HSP20 family protein